MNEEKRLSQSVARKFLITNSLQLKQKKSVKFYKKNYGVSNRIFVKFINKVLQKWRNYENSRVPIEDKNTILELSGRVQKLQNEVNCMNDSTDFQDAESFRSGNSHVTSRRVSFSPHRILEGMLRHSFVSPRRREGPSSFGTHMVYRETFLQIHFVGISPHNLLFYLLSVSVLCVCTCALCRVV